MIAKYNDRFFNIALNEQPKRLWRYDEVDGFNKRMNRNLAVYEKTVDASEINEIFDIGFSAFWHGQWCGLTYSRKTNRVELYSNNPSFAKEHGMEEEERFYYSIILPADSISEYKAVYSDARGSVIKEEVISLDELKVLWKTLITDLLPPND